MSKKFKLRKSKKEYFVLDNKIVFMSINEINKISK